MYAHLFVPLKIFTQSLEFELDGLGYNFSLSYAEVLADFRGIIPRFCETQRIYLRKSAKKRVSK